MRHKLFVYGSLLEGLHNSCLLTEGDADLIGETSVVGDYLMISMGSFPAVLELGGHAMRHNTIRGELWDVGEDTWKDIERLEGYPSFYDRTSVRTPLGQAEMYVLNQQEYGNGDLYEPVEDGDWRKYYNQVV